MVRKLLPAAAVFALMMTSCAGGPPVTAAEAREQWPDRVTCTVRAEFDCGDSVALYTLNTESDGETTVMTVAEPEALAGLTVSVTGGGAELSFGGAAFGVDGFAAGSVKPSPLTMLPAALRAVPCGVAVSEAAGTLGGEACSVIETSYNINGEPWAMRCFLAPGASPGQGVRLLRVEASLDGVRAFTADFLQWEGIHNG